MPRQLLDLLFFRTWWSYRPGTLPWFDGPYRAFNLLEGAAWIALAALVLRRHFIHRHSAVEVAYAAAFFAFGLTDFRESCALESWLLWLKGANLAVLLRLRSIVIGRYYPTSKLY